MSKKQTTLRVEQLKRNLQRNLRELEKSCSDRDVSNASQFIAGLSEGLGHANEIMRHFFTKLAQTRNRQGAASVFSHNCHNPFASLFFTSDGINGLLIQLAGFTRVYSRGDFETGVKPFLDRQITTLRELSQQAVNAGVLFHPDYKEFIDWVSAVRYLLDVKPAQSTPVDTKIAVLPIPRETQPKHSRMRRMLGTFLPSSGAPKSASSEKRRQRLKEVLDDLLENLSDFPDPDLAIEAWFRFDDTEHPSNKKWVAFFDLMQTYLSDAQRHLDAGKKGKAEKDLLKMHNFLDETRARIGDLLNRIEDPNTKLTIQYRGAKLLERAFLIAGALDCNARMPAFTHEQPFPLLRHDFKLSILREVPRLIEQGQQNNDQAFQQLGQHFLNSGLGCFLSNSRGDLCLPEQFDEKKALRLFAGEEIPTLVKHYYHAEVYSKENDGRKLADVGFNFTKQVGMQVFLAMHGYPAQTVRLLLEARSDYKTYLAQLQSDSVLLREQKERLDQNRKAFTDIEEALGSSNYSMQSIVEDLESVWEQRNSDLDAYCCIVMRRTDERFIAARSALAQWVSESDALCSVKESLSRELSSCCDQINTAHQTLDTTVSNIKKTSRKQTSKLLLRLAKAYLSQCVETPLQAQDRQALDALLQQQEWNEANYSQMRSIITRLPKATKQEDQTTYAKILEIAACIVSDKAEQEMVESAHKLQDSTYTVADTNIRKQCAALDQVLRVCETEPLQRRKISYAIKAVSIVNSLLRKQTQRALASDNTAVVYGEKSDFFLLGYAANGQEPLLSRLKQVLTTMQEEHVPILRARQWELNRLLAESDRMCWTLNHSAVDAKDYANWLSVIAGFPQVDDHFGQLLRASQPIAADPGWERELFLQSGWLGKLLLSASDSAWGMSNTLGQATASTAKKIGNQVAHLFWGTQPFSNKRGELSNALSEALRNKTEDSNYVAQQWFRQLQYVASQYFLNYTRLTDGSKQFKELVKLYRFLVEHHGDIVALVENITDKRLQAKCIEQLGKYRDTLARCAGEMGVTFDKTVDHTKPKDRAKILYKLGQISKDDKREGIELDAKIQDWFMTFKLKHGTGFLGLMDHYIREALDPNPNNQPFRSLEKALSLFEQNSQSITALWQRAQDPELKAKLGYQLCQCIVRLKACAQANQWPQYVTRCVKIEQDADFIWLPALPDTEISEWVVDQAIQRVQECTASSPEEEPRYQQNLIALGELFENYGSSLTVALAQRSFPYQPALPKTFDEAYALTLLQQHHPQEQITKDMRFPLAQLRYEAHLPDRKSALPEIRKQMGLQYLLDLYQANSGVLQTRLEYKQVVASCLSYYPQLQSELTQFSAAKAAFEDAQRGLETLETSLDKDAIQRTMQEFTKNIEAYEQAKTKLGQQLAAADEAKLTQCTTLQNSLQEDHARDAEVLAVDQDVRIVQQIHEQRQKAAQHIAACETDIAAYKQKMYELFLKKPVSLALQMVNEYKEGGCLSKQHEVAWIEVSQALRHVQDNIKAVCNSSGGRAEMGQLQESLKNLDSTLENKQEAFSKSSLSGIGKVTNFLRWMCRGWALNWLFGESALQTTNEARAHDLEQLKISDKVKKGAQELDFLPVASNGG